MTPVLHVQLLGEFHLTYGDTIVNTLHSLRLQSLLAYLLLHRHAPQSRNHLAFLFWPDSTEAQAQTNLRQLLHHLRHALPEAGRFLSADTKTLQWRPDAPFSFDVAEFEGRVTQADQVKNQIVLCSILEEAVALYKGDLLPNCYDGSSIG